LISSVGLQTGNLYSPWREEANRMLTSHIAALHFAPTVVSRDNLIREGIEPGRIIVTGNTVIDALLLTLRRVKRSQSAIEGLDDGLMKGKPFPRIVLITGTGGKILVRASSRSAGPSGS
jgi:UDP-N-acetylglucosamine 2-epimerase (non-hydrolysing)